MFMITYLSGPHTQEPAKTRLVHTGGFVIVDCLAEPRSTVFLRINMRITQGSTNGSLKFFARSLMRLAAE